MLISKFQNEIAPGKRPLSSMIPTLVYKTGHACGLRMVLGAANGTKIITGNYDIIFSHAGLIIVSFKGTFKRKIAIIFLALSLNMHFVCS